MTPEKSTLTQTQNPESENSQALKALIGTSERLINSFIREGLPLTGKVVTGNVTRIEQEKELQMQAERTKDMLVISFRVSEVPKNKVIKIWVADLRWEIPILTMGKFLGMGGKEIRNWFAPQTVIKLETPQRNIEFSPSSASSNADDLEYVTRMTNMVKAIVDKLNGQRKAIYDLSGKTIIAD